MRVGSRGVGEVQGVTDTLGVVLGHLEARGLLEEEGVTFALLVTEGLMVRLRVVLEDLLGVVESVGGPGVEEGEREMEGEGVLLFE